MIIDFWMQLPARGEVRVEASMSPPESDIGIDCWYPDGFTVFTAVDDEIARLTPAEREAVAMRCVEIADQEAHRRFESEGAPSWPT